MKVGFIILTLFILFGTARAGDVSCQVDLMQSKINAAIIQDEASMPTPVITAEGRINATINDKNEVEKATPEPNLETAQNEDNVDTKPTKKESRLGGLFDILLPSKLRDPARKL